MTAAAAAGPGATFAGFGSDAIAFFEELESDNSREWFAANRRRYDDGIAGPLLALGDGYADRYGTPKLFRPFRDVRFSADKRPIKEQAGLVLTRDDGALFYCQLSADGLLLGGGAYQPSKEQLARFRSLLDSPATAAGVRAAVAAAQRRGFDLMADGRLTGAPRGFARDHPEIELLRQTSLAVARHLPPGPWLHGPECRREIEGGWKIVDAWNAWLLAHVGR